ncbi:MAG: protein kinase domain-containing protein [Armatimonadota bacterium]
MSPPGGTVIAGRYEILGRIADGGMSTVYRARRSDGLIVALKIPREQYAADREFVERFTREARAAEGLRHPNIVQVYESGHDSDTYYIAMEYVDGHDLKEHLRRLGRLDPPDAERIATAVCEALDYAHHEGIVHRDVKPQNILIVPDGTVKVADFGIARALAAVTITQPGTVLGTVQYLSPEQARGAPVGRASDIYTLGAVLFEMLTGRLPFDGDTPIAIALKHLHDPPPRARAIQPDVPVRLEGIILKAMAKRSDDRYGSAREMATDLAGETDVWKETVPADDAVTRSFEMAEGLAGARRPRVAVLGVVTVVLAAIAIGLWTGWQALTVYLNVPEVEMPALVGRTVPQAELITRQAGLVLDVAERANSPNVPPDIVISQDQPPGKRLKQGRRVAVVVSIGARMATVPDLAQKTLQEARLSLDSANLRLGGVLDGHDDIVRSGIVLRQSPAAGATVPINSPVTLVISRGPQLVEMPALVGRTLAEARRVLDDRGLVLTHLRTVASTDVEPGIVLEQTPEAATRLRAGQTTITLTISARPGEEGAPPSAPVITVEPQPVEPPRTDPSPRPPASAPRPSAAPVAVQPSPRPVREASPGQARRTRVQIVVPEGGAQEVKIVVIDQTGVRTIYQAMHVAGDRIDQLVQSQGYTIVQVYIANRLVQEVRP